jgi:Protein of unknown function (DUF3307)
MRPELLFMLVAVHYLCDFPLQSDTMAREKRRRRNVTEVAWYWWMIAHGFIHGLGVFVVTRSLLLAVAEVVFHSVIDFGKCEGKYGMAVDQSLHMVCKLVWWGLLVRGAVA